MKTKRQLMIASLPLDWNPQSGLKYPTALKRTNGGWYTVNSYIEHTLLIKKLFLNQK